MSDAFKFVTPENQVSGRGGAKVAIAIVREMMTDEERAGNAKPQ